MKTINKLLALVRLGLINIYVPETPKQNNIIMNEFENLKSKCESYLRELQQKLESDLKDAEIVNITLEGEGHWDTEAIAKAQESHKREAREKHEPEIERTEKRLNKINKYKDKIIIEVINGDPFTPVDNSEAERYATNENYTLYDCFNLGNSTFSIFDKK